MVLNRVRNEDAPEVQIKWVDENGKIFKNIFTFKMDAFKAKRMADLFRWIVMCEEK